MNAVIPYQQFACPRCGAPGQVNYGQASYTCTCRFGTTYTPVVAPLALMKAGDRCGHCGRVWMTAPGGTGIWHECHTGAPTVHDNSTGDA